MGVPKIVVISYAIHQGLSKLIIKGFQRYDCARNMSEEKSTMRRGLIFAEILH